MYRWSTWFAGDPIDHYRILNVTRGASRAEIKKAFHRLALILHPDTSQTKCDTTELFYLAQSAYDILYNKMKRMVYDLFNPDAGKWTVEYTWDIDFCSRLSYIFIDDFFRLAWQTVLRTYQYGLYFSL
ncbi:Chaperone protein DnaJ [Mizuhopecten yessoensis]|uniref:Chaperone protein DnaJ n=2 Tax=Mizuhopecten yessoensis TaxID=6573 RepID=A0A210Q4F8_MIZYE|nr:Chaperone protein DnaJ [Mizuhopecten yessoensis]